MKNIKNIEKYTSESLAAKIVSYRILKINKEEAKDAMKELLKRKISGDNFDYNSYIKEKIDLIPKPTVGTDQLNILKNTLKRIKDGNI